jgi:hypothetical protein
MSSLPVCATGEQRTPGSGCGAVPACTSTPAASSGDPRFLHFLQLAGLHSLLYCINYTSDSENRRKGTRIPAKRDDGFRPRYSPHTPVILRWCEQLLLSDGSLVKEETRLEKLFHCSFCLLFIIQGPLKQLRVFREMLQPHTAHCLLT